MHLSSSLSRFNNLAAPSYSRRITMHQQVCCLLNGIIKFLNLKLYLDEAGRQCARSVGKQRLTFRKQGTMWMQVK